jgi:hypothetical protein
VSAESDRRLLASAEEMVANALAFKAEVLALIDGEPEERCGGMIREGVCTKPYSHTDACGLEVEGESCPAPADHPEPCAEADAACHDCGYPLAEHRWVEVPDSDAYPGGDGDFICPTEAA